MASVRNDSSALGKNRKAVIRSKVRPVSGELPSVMSAEINSALGALVAATSSIDSEMSTPVAVSVRAETKASTITIKSTSKR